MSEKKNKEIDDLMKNAQFNKEQGNLLDALYFLEEIIKIDKDNKRALNNIGNVFKEIGMYNTRFNFWYADGDLSNRAFYFGYKHKASIGFELEQKTFTGNIDTLEYLSINPMGSYSYDTRDVYRDPSKGLLITQGFFSILDWEKDKNNLWWVQSYSLYHSLNKSIKKLTAAFNFSFLTSFGKVDEVFVSWLGGAQNVRGWSIPTKSVYSNVDKNFRFGNHSAVFSTELRQTIIPTKVFKTQLMDWKQEYGLQLVGFIDVGYTARDKKDLFNFLPMLGTGFGFRIPFPMVGTFGLDFGWGYRDGSFVDQALHLVVGQKF